MQLFHRTTCDAANAIVDGGFRDGTGHYGMTQERSGVWLSDVPLDRNEGAKGEALLEVLLDLPEAVLGEYEFIEDGKPYREFLVPAAVIKRHGQVRLMSAEEEEEYSAPMMKFVAHVCLQNSSNDSTRDFAH